MVVHYYKQVFYQILRPKYIELKTRITDPQNIINAIKGTNIKLDENYYLNLDFNNSANRKVVQAIKYVKLPQLKSLRI